MSEAKLLWEHFKSVKGSDDLVFCKLCSKKLSKRDSNSTSSKPFNLTRHLKRRHKEEWQNIFGGKKKFYNTGFFRIL